MIIWGSKGKAKKIKEGVFFCPSCNSQTPYIHYQAGKYFTLYFIPIFQTEDLGEYIECQWCKDKYKPEILNQSINSDLVSLLAAERRILDAGTPIQAYIDIYVKQGREKSQVEDLVMMATGGKFSLCKQCKSLYTENNKYCSVCGSLLEKS